MVNSHEMDAFFGVRDTPPAPVTVQPGMVPSPPSYVYEDSDWASDETEEFVFEDELPMSEIDPLLDLVEDAPSRSPESSAHREPESALELDDDLPSSQLEALLVAAEQEERNVPALVEVPDDLTLSQVEPFLAPNSWADPNETDVVEEPEDNSLVPMGEPFPIEDLDDTLEAGLPAENNVGHHHGGSEAARENLLFSRVRRRLFSPDE